MPVTTELRHRLKRLAEASATVICRADKPERSEAKGFFVKTLHKGISVREAEEREGEVQIQRMFDDGCPHVHRDDDEE